MITTIVLLLAGFVAGAVNSVAGGGSLLTFPALLALGYPALQANVTNTIGVFPGNISGTTAYREELSGQREQLLRCSLAAGIGALGGAVLLLHTSEAVFRHVVPVLIALAALLILVQPLVAERLRRRTRQRTLERGATGEQPHSRVWAAPLTVGAISVYGGYFGAAIGVMLIAALGVLLPESLLRVNALKTALTLVVNGLSGVVFAIFASVAWGAALTLAVATLAGGYAGAGIARRLPEPVLRAVIVAIGIVAAVIVAVRG